MEPRALLLLPLLLAGCLGGGREATAPTPPLVVAPPPDPPLDILVRTDEWFPIEGATVLLVGPGLAGVSNASGGLRFPALAPGGYDLVASHPRYFTNRTHVTIEDNRSEPLGVELRELPHAKVVYAFPYGSGVCVARRIDPLVHDTTCQDDPDPNLRPYVNFTLPDNFHAATLNLSWAPGSVSGARALRFEVRVLDADGRPLVFRDGADVLVAEGGSPLGVRIPNDLTTPAMRSGEHTLRVLAFPSELGPPAPTYSQPYDVRATIGRFVPAPSPD